MKYIKDILKKMEPEKKIVKLNGSITSQMNYLWGGALSLAWHELRTKIIKQNIQINSSDPHILEIVSNFNHCPFKKDALSNQCYYATAGFGNATVNKINSEVSKKFPDKTTGPISADLNDEDIIAYAYFLKNMKFQFPFKKGKVPFLGKKIKGFRGDKENEKKQVKVYKYVNQDNFLVRLSTRSNKDEIFLFKSDQKFSAEQVIEKVNGLNGYGRALKPQDEFFMPNISIKHRRSLKELVGKTLTNQKFAGYVFSEIYEIIKLDVDETGVRVENQGAIKMLKCKKKEPTDPPKLIFLDKPFWIVMRQKQNHPYFIAFIQQPTDK